MNEELARREFVELAESEDAFKETWYRALMNALDRYEDPFPGIESPYTRTSEVRRASSLLLLLG
jgi:hypothetical protein